MLQELNNSSVSNFDKTIKSYHTIANLKYFDPDVRFKYSDFWTEITETNPDPIIKLPSDGKSYELMKCVITDELDKSNKRIFVVAQEIFSEAELQKLEPFCQCDICSAPYFSINKWFGCRCCVGCIKSGVDFVSEYNVKRARELYEVNPN